MPLEITGSTEALLAKAEVAQPHLVILDLSHPGLDPGQLVPRLVELIGPAAAILAFGPHVHEARLAAAAAAGCHSVISRGQFRAQMEQILRQYAS
jgi:DNA-binding NarL/FixJ family response regulator